MLRVQLGCERRFNIEFYGADSHFCHSAYVTWYHVELWSAHAPARLSHFRCRTHFARRDRCVECSKSTRHVGHASRPCTVIPGTYVLGSYDAGEVIRVDVNRERFFCKREVKMGRVVPNCFDQNSVTINTRHLQGRYGMTALKVHGRGTFSWTGGELSRFSSPLSNCTVGDGRVSKKDVQKWRTEVRRDKDLSCSFRISA